MKHVNKWFISCVTTLIIPLTLYSYPTGPPDGRTGAPGEQTCNSVGCHNSFALNSGNGSLQFGQFPAEYETGQTYNIEVILQDPGQSRWGFECVALDGNGLQAGTITVTNDTLMQTSTTNNKTYIKHKEPGTYNGTNDGPVSWQFNWTAPAGDIGTVYFYVAGNAANGDNTSQGDYIYTYHDSVTAAPTSIHDEKVLPASPTLASAYPNPFNPSTTIEFELPKADNVILRILNDRGEIVNVLLKSRIEQGAHHIRWNGVNQTGQQVASGIYFYQLITSSGVFVRKMTLIR